MPFKPHYCVYGSCVLPQRYVVCFMAFCGVIVCYTMRVTLHIAITEMVIPSTSDDTAPDEGGSICPGEDVKDKPIRGGQHNWTEAQQGLILSAFYPGYVISHIPGGFLADVFGAKHVLSGGIALSALFTFLTPIIVNHGGSWWGIVIIRILVGIGQGPLYPCLSTLLSRWVPLRERTTLGAFVNTGNQMGSIFGNLISALMMVHVSWPIVFYFWGAIAMVWYAIFIILCHSDPSQHPFITNEEAEMLEQEIGRPKKRKVPWKKIFSDPVTYALLCGQTGHDWIFFMIVTQLPTYFRKVLKFSVKQNGVLNAIPYFCLWACSIITGAIADYCITKKGVSILRMRQIYTFVGNVGPGFCVLLASYLGCNRAAASVMFIFGMFTMGPFFSGMKVNVLDITKNFAGIIMAVVNGLAALFFIPVPYLTALVTTQHTIEQWRVVFYVLFVSSFVATLLYLFFTSADRADWDEDE